MRVDFHSHTLASDGELDAAALRALQRAAGTALMAITDHDTLAGYDACRALPPEEGAPQLVSGIELTASHEGREYHVVGLRFDADDPAFRAAVAAQQQRRRERAEGIAAALDYLGIPGSLEAATRIAAGAALGRPHFARFLVETGRVNSIDKAFDRYLGRGKPAGPKTDWPPLAAIVGWLHAAGGVAVLAHPLSYELGRAQIKKLIAAFAAAGGDAVEVALPGLNPQQMERIARLTRDAGLLASAGSDFHHPGQIWRFPRNIPALPPESTPLWRDWV